MSVRSSISAPMQRAAEARAGMDRDESTAMDRDTVIYHTVDADADSVGPGSDRDRAHGSSGVHYIPDNANPLPTPPSRKSAQQHAARSTGHAQQPHDAADTSPPDSPASVIVAHTATPAASVAKPRPQQKTRQASDSQNPDALASAGGQQTEQKQTRTTRDVDAPRPT